jgi:hypothetical protein
MVSAQESQTRAESESEPTRRQERRPSSGVTYRVKGPTVLSKPFHDESLLLGHDVQDRVDCRRRGRSVRGLGGGKRRQGRRVEGRIRRFRKAVLPETSAGAR